MKACSSYGLFHTIITRLLLFEFKHFKTFQKMRYFHILYLRYLIF
jgi:hypothetical protein